MTEKVRKFFEESEGVGRRMEPAAAGEHPVEPVVEASPAPKDSDETEGEE